MDDLERRQEKERRNEIIDIRDSLSRLHVEYNFGSMYLSDNEYRERKAALDRRLKELGV